MFLGLGYMYEKLLLYYVMMLMLKYGIDVVYIYYIYLKEFMIKFIDEIVDVMMKDIDFVL